MINQKQIVIPKVGATPVTEYDATGDFTTELIEFPNSRKDWSIDLTFDDTITGATLDVLVCNTYNGTYKNYTTIDLETTTLYFDEIMPFQYMKLDYTAGTTLGVVSIKVCK